MRRAELHNCTESRLLLVCLRRDLLYSSSYSVDVETAGLQVVRRALEDVHHRRPFLDGVQDDVVRSRHAATRLLPASGRQMLLGDAEVEQRPPCLELVVPERGGGSGVRRLGGRSVRLVGGNRLGERLAVEPRRVLDLLQRVPIGGDRSEDAPDEELAPVGHVLRHRVRSLEDALLQPADRLGAKRKDADDDEVQEDAERPDVDEEAVVAVVAEELRGGVRRRTAERVQRFAHRARSAKSKVADLDEASAGEQDVLCLEIAVDYLIFVLKLIQNSRHTCMRIEVNPRQPVYNYV